MGTLTVKISVYIIPPLLFLITGFSLAILSIVKGRRNYENVTFGILCIWFSLLSVAFLSHFIFWGDLALILRIERVIHFLYVYLPAIAILFFHHIVRHKNRIITVLSFLLSFVLSLSTFTDYYFYGFNEFSWGYIAKGGPAFQVMGAYSLVVIAYSAILAFRKLKTTEDPASRLRLKYLILAMCVIGILSLGNIPAINGINFYPVGNFSFIPMLVMAWGIYRHDLITINQYTKRRIFGTILKVFIITVLSTSIAATLWVFSGYQFGYILARTIPYGIPPLLSFVVCLVLSVIGLQVGENRKESFIFSIAILVYALLGLDIYFNCVVPDQELCLLASRTNHAFLVFLPTLILHLVSVVTERIRPRRILALAYVLSAALALSTHSDLYFTGSIRYYWGYFAQAGPLFNTMGLLGTICLIYSLLLMLKSFRETANRNTRRRYLFLLIGTSSTGLLTLGNIPAMLGYEIYPAGNFVFIPVILLTMGMFRYNISELTRFGGRIIYYGVLAAGVAFAAVYLPGLLRGIPAPANHALAFTSILAFGYAWRLFHRRIFSSRRTALAGAYEDLSYGLSKCHNRHDIGNTLSNSLFRMLSAECCTFLHLDASRHSYTVQMNTQWTPQSTECGNEGKNTATVPGNHPLLDLFFSARRPVSQDEIEEWILRNDRRLRLDDSIRTATISIPFFFEDKLMGLLLLGPKRDGSLYSKEERDFLFRLCLGVGPFLENVNILQHLEQIIDERTGELRNSEMKFRHLVENATDGIFRNDIRGNFIFVNPSGLKFLQYSLEEIASMNYRDLVPPEYLEAVMQHFLDQLHGAIPETYLELPVVQKSGSRIWLGQNVRLEKNAEGKYEFYGISRDVTERKQAELALKSSEKKYRDILRSINEAYYEVDLKGTINFVNNSFCSLIGYGMKECIGTSYRMYMEPKNAADIFSIFHRIHRTGMPSEIFDLRFRRKDGSECIAQGTASLIVDDKGEKLGFRGLLRDVTDLKSAEEALRASEQRYRDFIEKLPLVVFEVDRRGVLTYVNTAGLRLLGYSSEEVVQRPAVDFIQAEEHQSVFHGMEKIIREGKAYQNIKYHAVRKDGTLMPVHMSTSRIMDESRGGGFQGIMVDLTRIEKTQDDLRESEERYRLIVESASDAIYRVDAAGRFTFVNSTCLGMSGFTREELLSMHFWDLVHPEQRKSVIKIALTQISNDIGRQYYEFPVVKKDGNVFWVGQYAMLVRNKSGDPEFHVIARDITEQKAAEAARRELEEQKGRFFANVSHEIRTPLTLMLSPIESYLQGDYRKEIDRDFFKNLYRNGLRLLKLINNLLDFSKIEAGRMTMTVVPMDIVQFIRTYVTSLQSACDSRGITLAFVPENSIENLYADPEKVDKILMNLLSNALKYTDANGSITIRLRDDEVYCFLEIEDTGQGIPSHSLEKIFDRFGQAESGDIRIRDGTGIGLALARELVEMHGGTITVTSRFIEDHPDDHGSVFTVTLLKGKEHLLEQPGISFGTRDGLSESITDSRLRGLEELSHPLMPAEEENAEIPSSPDLPKILVVDDNPDMRVFLSTLMKGRFTIITAVNGSEGLRMMEKHAPDLVIADVMMPVMDGYEMTRCIKKDAFLRHTPVIMLTAKAELSHKIEGLEYGADDYLTKPFNSKELLARVKTLLKTREYEKIIIRRNAEIEKEIEVARMLQQRLLPGKIVDIPGYSTHAVYIPMDRVGGDFYDYAQRGKTIDLFIADVSGHGLPGAFLAMMTKVALESVSDRRSTRRTLALLNDVIHRATVNSNFVTAFYCTLDTRLNTLKYCNAGHLPPLVFRRSTGEFHELTSKGMLLGWLSHVQLEEKKFQLESGDRLILFTDGIVECMNPSREQFGDDRFLEFIRSHADQSPAEFSSSLIDELRRYSVSGRFEDDLTMVVFDVN